MLLAEGRVTVIDGLLALAVLVGLLLNITLGAWWADPAAGMVIVYYAVREAHSILTVHDDAESVVGLTSARPSRREGCQWPDHLGK